MKSPDGWNDGRQSALACNVAALSAAERNEHRELATRLAGAVTRTRELADGYAFELAPGRVPVSVLAAWIDFERRCCPFFDIAVEWSREDGPVIVRLTGRDGVKPFIQAEFPTIA
ncbi:hypothetical protein BH23ACI1_BH23ACI1_19980 [soil metagenome]|nr:hypothetical protein [Acidobacteriota bacterium]